MSLRYRIALTIFILEAAVMATVLWQTLSSSTESVREQISTSQQTTLQLLGELSRIALFVEEYDELERYIENVETDPSVERILLADREGRVVTSSRIGSLGHAIPDTTLQANHYWTRKALSNELGHLGEIAIEFSNARLIEAQAEARTLGWTVAISGMIFIAVVGVLMGYLLTRRLDRLQSMAEQLAAGNLQVRTRVTGKDEIARLGTAFDGMADKLAEKITDLESSQRRLRDSNTSLLTTSDELYRIRENLEQLVHNRTLELEHSNQELDSFCHSVSHDLRAPLRSINGFSDLLMAEHHDNLDEEAQLYLQRIHKASTRMGELINDLLALSKVSRSEINPKTIDVQAMAEEVLADLHAAEPERRVEESIEPGLEVCADPRLFRIVLENLLGNAWKYSANCKPAHIELGLFQCTEQDSMTLFVRDNGAGFDMQYADKLFEPFQRLHQDIEFAGTGIGLATVMRVIRRHHGRIWGESKPGAGATFYLQLPLARHDETAVMEHSRFDPATAE